MHGSSATTRAGVLACLASALLGVVQAYPTTFGRPDYRPGQFQFFDEAVFTAQFPLVVAVLLAVRSVHGPRDRGWGRLGAVALRGAVLGCSLVVVKQVLVVLNAAAGLPLTQAVVTVLMTIGSALTLVGVLLVAAAVLRARVIPTRELAVLSAAVLAAVVASAVAGRATATVTAGALWCLLAVVLWRRTRRPDSADAAADRQVLAS